MSRADCAHTRLVGVTDFDTPPGTTVEMCRDCGTQISRDTPPVRYSLMSPVEVLERTVNGVRVRSANGDSWWINPILFDSLYRETKRD